MHYAALKITILIVTASYNQMNKADQDEYLKLHNRFAKENEKKRQGQLKEWVITNQIDKINDLGVERVINIIGIYDTNCFQKGVGIQSARFNHSCCSNAEAVWNDEEDIREIR